MMHRLRCPLTTSQTRLNMPTQSPQSPAHYPAQPRAQGYVVFRLFGEEGKVSGIDGMGNKR
ncbi:MAG: hypothetical protein F4Y44_05655 [Chloroflexi bacterium]|nr:hypothetical protein [Chloroflexota bacterium]